MTLNVDKKNLLNKKVVSKKDKTFVFYKFSSKTNNKGEIKEKANCLMTDGRTQVNYRGASLLKSQTDLR